jgi:hypothetical protein
MAIFKPGQSSDDCNTVPAASDMDSTSPAFALGRITNYYSSGVRFINVTIPQGATVLTAKVTLQARGSNSGTACHVQIKGEDIDDATTFSTYADYAGRTRTTEYKAWESIPAWTIDTDYDSPDITNIIQEIVDRGGWASGNDLVLFFDSSDSDSYAYRSAKSYDHSTTLCPRLDVTWAAAQHYTLTADGGSYGITGQTAGLSAARKVAAGQGSYALTGQAASLKMARKMAAGAGSYSLTGQDAGLRAIRKMAAEGGSYVLTGQAANLKLAKKIPAGAGSYALTGQDAVLRAIRKMAAAGGSYVLTGMDANLALSKHYTLVCEAGYYGEPYSKIFVTLDGRIYKKMGDTYLRLA